MISFAPKAVYYHDMYSSITQPRRRVIHRADGSEAAVFREADLKTASEYELLPAEIVEVKAPDGAVLFAKLIRPSNFDPAKKYPAVVSVYGGPHAQIVQNSWASELGPGARASGHGDLAIG